MTRIIAEVIRLRESGATLVGIADRLNERGIEGKRGGRWHPSEVRYLLQRR